MTKTNVVKFPIAADTTMPRNEAVQAKRISVTQLLNPDRGGAVTLLRNNDVEGELKGTAMRTLFPWRY